MIFQREHSFYLPLIFYETHLFLIGERQCPFHFTLSFSDEVVIKLGFFIFLSHRFRLAQTRIWGVEVNGQGLFHLHGPCNEVGAVEVSHLDQKPSTTEVPKSQPSIFIELIIINNIFKFSNFFPLSLKIIIILSIRSLIIVKR